MSKRWYSTLREIVKNRPYASNVVISFLLVVLEKLLDMEFVCPCKKWSENASFVSAFFILPAVLAFLLMISLQIGTVTSAESNKKSKFCEEPKRQTKEIDKNCIIPAVAWIIILLFDGRYVACGMTDQPGTYVTADKAALVKWCETDNSTLNEKQLKNSQDWYFHSQCAGLSFTLLVACLGCCIHIWKCWQNENTSSGKNGTGNETTPNNDKTERTEPEEVISMTNVSPTVQSSPVEQN